MSLFGWKKKDKNGVSYRAIKDARGPVLILSETRVVRRGIGARVTAGALYGSVH